MTDRSVSAVRIDASTPRWIGDCRILMPPSGLMIGYGSPPIERPNRVLTDVCAQSGFGARSDGMSTAVTYFHAPLKPRGMHATAVIRTPAAIAAIKNGRGLVRAPSTMSAG